MFVNNFYLSLHRKWQLNSCRIKTVAINFIFLKTSPYNAYTFIFPLQLGITILKISLRTRYFYSLISRGRGNSKGFHVKSAKNSLIADSTWNFVWISQGISCGICSKNVPYVPGSSRLRLCTIFSGFHIGTCIANLHQSFFRQNKLTKPK